MRDNLLVESGEKVKKEEIASLCTECQVKPRLSKNCPLCPGCMSKRAHKNDKKKAKRKQTPKMTAKGKNNRKTASGIDPTEIMQPGAANGVIHIDFQKHMDVFNQVAKLAEEELRPLDLQIIYILKSYRYPIKTIDG